MNRSRVSIAKPKIENFFEENEKKIFSFLEIEKIFNSQKSDWKLANSMSSRKFAHFLVSEKILKEIRLNFLYRPVTRYCRGEYDIYHLLQIAKHKSFFSHYSALVIHNLFLNLKNEIFINEEQMKKSDNNSIISQSGIDAAFKRPQRTTSNYFTIDDYKISLLNGMNTNELGVINMTYRNIDVRVTNIARTLIDIIVRPNYSGSPEEIIYAYKMANNKFSVFEMVDYLKNINYLYPYHQCIGFYMDAAGVYSENLVEIIFNMKIKNNFYLVNDMKSMKFSEKWKIYYPSDIHHLLPVHIREN